MSNPSQPSGSSPLPGDDRNVVAAGTQGAESSFEDQLHAFWNKNRRFILFLAVLGIAVIVGRELITYMWKERERAVSEAYGAAGTPEKLKAFAEENSGHSLAGFALIRVADEAYKEGNYAEAATAYEKAVEPLKGTPMAARARLGAAVSLAQGSDRAKGEAALKALADDAAIMPAQRTEARYHLATLMIGEGRIDEARTTLQQIMETDTTGSWAQRAYMLLAGLPAASATVGLSTPAATTPVPAATGAPEIKLNLPGSNP